MKRAKGKLYSLVYRACEWHIIYRRFTSKGTYTYEAFAFDYENGLTEDQAYRLVQFPGSPTRYECVCTPLNSWPFIEDETAHAEPA